MTAKPHREKSSHTSEHTNEEICECLLVMFWKSCASHNFHPGGNTPSPSSSRKREKECHAVSNRIRNVNAPWLCSAKWRLLARFLQVLRPLASIPSNISTEVPLFVFIDIVRYCGGRFRLNWFYFGNSFATFISAFRDDFHKIVTHKAYVKILQTVRLKHSMNYWRSNVWYFCYSDNIIRCELLRSNTIVVGFNYYVIMCG